MTYRGENQTPQTVQVFTSNGWEEFDAIKLEEGTSVTTSTLYKETTGGSLGFTGDMSTESLSGRLDAGASSGGPTVAKEKLYAVLEGDAQTNIPYDLPTTVNGVSPNNFVPPGQSRSVYVAEVTFYTTSNGSDLTTKKYLCTWNYFDSVDGYIDMNYTELSGPKLGPGAGQFSTDLVADTIGSPGVPRIILNCADSASNLRFFLEIEITLLNYSS